MNQPITTLASEWASFENDVLRNPSREQTIWLRRAFYSGAVAFFHSMVAGFQAGKKDCADLEDELKAFRSFMGDGMA